MTEPRLMHKEKVAVADVDASKRLRPVSSAGVESLMASIAEVGVMKDAIHVRQRKDGTQGNESDKYAVAGYFQSWNLAQPVLVAEGTRTSGNVVELFRLISGLAHTAGKKAMRLLAQVGGVQTERFALWIDGALIIGGYSAAEIGDSTHPINTTAKVTAKTIRDTTNGNRWIQASGSGATDPWMLLDGVTVAITPAPPP